MTACHGFDITGCSNHLTDGTSTVIFPLSVIIGEGSYPCCQNGSLLVALGSRSEHLSVHILGQTAQCVRDDWKSLRAASQKTLTSLLLDNRDSDIAQRSLSLHLSLSRSQCLEADCFPRWEVELFLIKNYVYMYFVQYTALCHFL